MYLVNLFILILGAPLVLFFVPMKLATWLGLKYKSFLIVPFSLLTIAAVVFSLGFSRSRFGEITFLYQFGFSWFGFVLFLTLLVLTYFLLGKLIPIKPKTASYCILISTLMICSYAYYNAQNYKNYDLTLELEHLNESITIYHVPDVHFGIFAGKERAQKIVDNINTIKPDLVIFNGDLFDSHTALKPEVLEPFKNTSIPLYFTTGNHDNYVGIEEIHTLLKEHNIRILENDIIEIKGAQILGIDYLNADENYKDPHSAGKKETIKSIMPTLNLDKNKPIIIAHHSPVGAKYMAESGGDLFLAGHTHGGQIFPATYIAKTRFEYSKGLYTLDNMNIYVTQGVGTFGPPMRLGTEAEATIVKLVPKTN